jgi:Pyruvate/2-oxoacid:ferredoxin oxidoreductase delta subunit
MPRRRIIEIDEDKCDGCELCVSACHEGAIAIVNGKAKLVSDVYCDGLGDCIGECPQGAIAIIERNAVPFDALAVADQRAGRQQEPTAGAAMPGASAPAVPLGDAGIGARPGGCPGTHARMLQAATPTSPHRPAQAGTASALGNWPVQLHLVPVQAPYYEGATLLIAADCVPFAYPDFHTSLLAGRTVLIGCPKLDDTSAYAEKLAAILRFNDVVALEVAIMEVPCCRGLVRLVQQARELSGKALPMELVQIGIRGDRTELSWRASA